MRAASGYGDPSNPSRPTLDAAPFFEVSMPPYLIVALAVIGAILLALLLKRWIDHQLIDAPEYCERCYAAVLPEGERCPHCGYPL